MSWKPKQIDKNKKIEKECPQCHSVFESWVCQKRKFCSKVCYSASMVGRTSNFRGRHWSEESRKRMSEIMKGKYDGDKHPQWISDRTKLKKREQRNDMAYQEWRRQVWLRDNFKCKIGNQDCQGRLEAHHILTWRDYPELRYEINNGITLCHFHHPRKRDDEKKLSPYFQKLVNEKKTF